jgi:hypothetical protein
MRLRTMHWILVVSGLLCFGAATAGADQHEVRDSGPAADGDSVERLAASVLALGLGEQEFVIGSTLTAAQIELARGNLIAETYPGTIKFPSGDIVVVADEESHLVLAIYERREEIRADDVKEMVGQLMTRYGEPTTMAHGTLIYWAFGPSGRIDAETYADSKTTGTIDILATVKFSSTLAVNPGMGNDNMEEIGTIYYIIASDRLLNSYLASP